MPKSVSLPLKPLELICRVEADLPVYDAADRDSGVFNDQIFASMIGVSSRAISRWRAEPDPDDYGPAYDPEKKGRLPWTSADEAAIALGLHPYNIWVDDWLEIDREVIENGKDHAHIERAMKKIGKYLAAQEKAEKKAEAV